MKKRGTSSLRRKKHGASSLPSPTIASSRSFQCLVVLVGTTLIICVSLPFFLHEEQGGAIATSFANILHTDNGGQQLRANRDYMADTIIPIRPLNAKDITDALERRHQNHDNDMRPNMMKIVARIYRFLEALAESNDKIANQVPTVPANKLSVAVDIHAAYKSLVAEHLLPLDDPSITPPFPIRDDDSIFLSVAAYREHLLADTLKSAFLHATHPEKLYAGVIVQNCHENCKTGKGKYAPPDVDGVRDFCNDADFAGYCRAGQIRPLYVNATSSLGPAVTRFYASQLWGGETYYCQVDAHLKFARMWDELYVTDVKLTSNYPKSILSAYPPGFVNFRQEPPYTPSNRLCRCGFSKSEGNIVRIEMEGRTKANITRPTQMPFTGAGFFFAPAGLLKDVKFDPFLPWGFMGEEVAFSIRAWTSGWDIYAPRLNLIGHHYRPLNLGLPHYWDTVDEIFHTHGMNDCLEATTLNRIKRLLGYPDRLLRKIPRQGKRINTELGEEFYNESFKIEQYGLGNLRTREDYLSFAEIDYKTETCGPLKWCSNGDLD